MQGDDGVMMGDGSLRNLSGNLNRQFDMHDCGFMFLAKQAFFYFFAFSRGNTHTGCTLLFHSPLAFFCGVGGILHIALDKRIG